MTGSCKRREMLPGSGLALGDVSFHHCLGLGESGPSLSVCHKSPGAGAESPAHLQPPNVNNPQTPKDE